MSKLTAIFFTLLIILTIGPVNARLGVYKCTGEGGTISYQQKPCKADEPTMLEKKGITDEQSFQDHLIVASVNLGQREVSMIGWDWWKASFKEHNERFAFLKWTGGQDDTDFSLLIDIMAPEDIDSMDQNKIRTLSSKLMKNSLGVSVENKINLKPISVEGVVGFYQQFTDKNLLGKDSYPPGEYLYFTKGLFKKSGLLFRFTLLSNDYSAQNQQFAFSFLTNGIKVNTLTENNGNPVDENLTSYESGMVLLKQGKILDSVAYFAQATQEEPDKAAAWVAYCLGLREFNRLQSAFVACNKANRLEPDNLDTKYRILNLLVKARIYDQALELAKELIGNQQTAAITNTINNLAYYALVDNNLDIAKQSFDLLIERGENNFKISADRAILAAINGDTQSALKILEGADISSDIARDHIAQTKRNIKNGPPYIDPHEDEESYVEINDQLRNLNTGTFRKDQIDPWVTQVHPLKGVAEVRFLLPEEWEVKTERKLKGKNDQHHSLTIRSVQKGNTTTLFSLDVAKMSPDWTLVDLKQNLMNMQGLFYEDPLPKLVPLKGNKKGFSFRGDVKKEDTLVRLTITGELVGSIMILAHGVEVSPDLKQSGPMQKIIDSISLKDSLPNSIDVSSDKLNEGSKAKNKQLNQSQKKANDTPLPEPEKGFTWHRMPKAQAAFLKPDGWFTIQKHETKYHVYSIMKEDIEANEQFETGLTLMAFPQLADWAGMSPFTFVLDSVYEIENNSNNKIIKQEDISQGPFNGYLIQYENNPDELPPIIIHKVFTANEKTGSVYIASFEAPKETWQEAWKLGETMMKYYLLDDAF